LPPAILVAAPRAHLLLMIVNKHKPVRCPGAPTIMSGVPIIDLRGEGRRLFFVVFRVIVLIASFFTINPIWTYGPRPRLPSVPQPDWYIGFADGMLRLIPRWEVSCGSTTPTFNIIVITVILIAPSRDRRDLSLRRSVDYGRQA
jgi:ubiquinol-cytochrome c reductase cytochrome b subunit